MSVHEVRVYRALSETTERRTLLPKVWLLAAPDGTAPVHDVERLCRAAVVDAARWAKPRPPLSPSEFEDTLGHVLGEVAVLHDRYVAAPGREFAPYLFDRARKRAIDHWRQWFGRNGQKRVLGADAAFTVTDSDDEEPDLDDGAAPVRRSRGAAADPADDWIAHFGGLDAGGDRGEAGAATLLGLGPDRRAAGHARRAGAAQRGADAGPAARRAGGAAFLDCAACGWRTYRQSPNGRPDWHWPEACLGCGARLAEVAA